MAVFACDVSSEGHSNGVLYTTKNASAALVCTQSAVRARVGHRFFFCFVDAANSHAGVEKHRPPRQSRRGRTLIASHIWT